MVLIHALALKVEANACPAIVGSDTAITILDIVLRFWTALNSPAKVERAAHVFWHKREPGQPIVAVRRGH